MSLALLYDQGSVRYEEIFSALIESQIWSHNHWVDPELFIHGQPFVRLVEGDRGDVVDHKARRARIVVPQDDDTGIVIDITMNLALKAGAAPAHADAPAVEPTADEPAVPHGLIDVRGKRLIEGGARRALR